MNINTGKGKIYPRLYEICLYTFIFTLVTLSYACKFVSKQQDKDPISYVNPLIGTDISIAPSAKVRNNAMVEVGLYGKNVPFVGVPNAMTHWTPQTRNKETKGLPPYYYKDKSIQGFRGSHWMSGSPTQDYGSVTIMSVSGKLKFLPQERASKYKHENEKATPAYYSVKLDDYNIQAEVTGSCYSGFFRFTYLDNDSAYIVINPNSDEGQGYVEVDPAKNEIRGYNPVHRIYAGWGEPAGFIGHFIVKFDKPFTTYGTWKGNAASYHTLTAKGDTSVGAFVCFSVKAKDVIRAKVGMSFTSIAQARKNLDTEIPLWNFEEIRKNTEKIWNERLGVVQVKGGTEKDKTIFYTALYHSMMLPRVFSDVDGSYDGFSNRDSNIYTAKGFKYYEDYSLWDTYRALHPLMTIVSPERSRDMVISMIKKGEQGGWLPIFPCWNNYTAEMIGDHAISLITDAYMKGIKGIDVEKAYSLMLKNAMQQPDNYNDYKDGRGRRALTSYLRYGFIPLEDSVKEAFHNREQVARTLEYAYDDFVLAMMAQKLGRQEDYNKLIKRALFYKNVFDTSVGFVRGRHADGSWIEPFNPAIRANYVSEATPWQYTWYVPHDVQGLIQLMGGEDIFIKKLDTFFQKQYYWQGDEQAQQSPFMYNYAGVPWKTQKQVRDIMKNEYNMTTGGLCGNDDAGQISAWYVFAAMGFYPVCPGTPYYAIASPGFQEVSISLPDGKIFKIIAKDASDENIYIQSAQLNGKPYNKTYFSHDDILNGSTFVFQMGNKPNKQWGSTKDAVPYSVTK